MDNGINTNNKIYNYITENNNNELVATDYYGNRTVVGYTKKYVEDLQALCLEHKAQKEEYYNLLVEKGIIQKELTQEEKLNLLLEKIDKQDNRIKELEGLLRDKQNGQANLFEDKGREDA